MVSYSLKPYAFLMVNFALLLKPSTTPVDSPCDSNQFSGIGSCLSSVAAIFCIGSICDWFARMHQSRKNFDAQVGEVYVQNRLKSSRIKYAFMLFKLYFSNSRNFTVCLLVRFSGRLSKHHLECVKIGSYPSASNWRVSSARTLSNASPNFLDMWKRSRMLSVAGARFLSTFKYAGNISVHANLMP